MNVNMPIQKLFPHKHLWVGNFSYMSILVMEFKISIICSNTKGLLCHWCSCRPL